MVPAALALLLIAAAPLEAVKPPTITVVRGVAGSLGDIVVLTGTLVPREEVLINPQQEGLAITKLRAEEGDRVEAGQVLAELSHDVLDASLAQNAAQLARSDAAIAQAQSNIQEAEATRSQAESAFGRSRDLLATGSASRETFEARQQAAQVASARLANVQNALHSAVADRALVLAQKRELEVRLAQTFIRTPVAGIVSRRVARLGAVPSIMVGDPLFRIIQDGAIELEADVPETRLSRLHPGQRATIDEAAAHVRLVAPEVSRTTRLGRVRIAFDQAAPGVIGSFARGRVEVAVAEGVKIPLSAVLFDPDGARVQVVKDGLVETRPVTIGLSSGGTALVTAGLADGEAVVSVSATFVRGGDRVTPVGG
jgi:RND family efflux transporter MFP subunit